MLSKKKQRKVSGTSRERHQTLPEEEKEKKAKKHLRQIWKSFWRRKRKESWIYEILLFST